MRILVPVLAVISLAAGCATNDVGTPVPVASASASMPLAVSVGVDERVELLAIIFRLAGNSEYNDRFVPDYVAAIEAHFGRFKDHPAVTAAAAMRMESGVSYNAVVDLAVQLGPFPGLAERVAFEDAELDPRMTPEAARALVALTRDFARDTDAAAFFASQRPLYAVAERRMRNLIDDETNLRWLTEFYGGAGQERFFVVPAPGNGQTAYGSRYYGPEGEREFYATINVRGVDEDGLPAFGVGNASLLVHEFGHSFVTPLIVDNYDADLATAGESLLAAFGNQMSAQGYGLGSTVIHESIIRAGVARYKLAHGGEVAAERELARQRRLGFLWIDDLYALLGDYERSRTAYPTFASYYPVIRTYFQGVSARIPGLKSDYDARRPKVAEVSIAQNAEDVDPATKQIVFRFDQPMMRSWGLVSRPETRDREVVVTGSSMDPAGMSWTVDVKLEPNRDYEAELHSNFVSEKNVPLGPYVLRFRTGAAR